VNTSPIFSFCSFSSFLFLPSPQECPFSFPTPPHLFFFSFLFFFYLFLYFFWFYSLFLLNVSSTTTQFSVLFLPFSSSQVFVSFLGSLDLSLRLRKLITPPLTLFDLRKRYRILSFPLFREFPLILLILYSFPRLSLPLSIAIRCSILFSFSNYLQSPRPVLLMTFLHLVFPPFSSMSLLFPVPLLALLSPNSCAFFRLFPLILLFNTFVLFTPARVLNLKNAFFVPYIPFLFPPSLERLLTFPNPCRCFLVPFL